MEPGEATLDDDVPVIGTFTYARRDRTEATVELWVFVGLWKGCSMGI